MPATFFPETVVDDDGKIHHLIQEPLGRGGQGVVLRTRNPHIAVKLIGEFTAPSSGTAHHQAKVASKQEALRRRLEDVRLLPLPDLHMARPLAMLRDQVGYTMQLLQDMAPIRSLIVKSGEKNTAEFYRSTGGLGRRLDLLAKTAGLLARVHAIPLVYADISDNNIFVSAQTDASEVWLIDLDNLDYVSANSTGIYTPGFGAPEVVAGRAGVSTLSDAYAFAVLAFQVLAQTHPFLGDYVENGGWDGDDGTDREALAFRGEVPWIEDSQDDSNHTSNGIPRHLVLSKPVRELFQRTFEAGRMDRLKRPGLSEWADVLRRAADRVVVCPACRSSFDVTAGRCPFCPASPRPSFIHLQVNRWEPGLDESEASVVSTRAVWHQMLDAGQDSVGVVLRHVVEPVLADAEDFPVLQVRMLHRDRQRTGIAIEALSGHEVHVVLGQRIQRIEREMKLPVPRAGHEVYLHFGPLDRPHRMAVLRLQEGT